MWHAMIHLAAAGFGGAELAVLGETDEGGAEALIDVGVTPFTLQRDALTFSWAETQVGWSVLTEAERLDRLELSVLQGQAAFGSGTTHASFAAGDVTWDPEDGALELGVIRGGMGGQLFEERLTWGVGGDLHARRVDGSASLMLGLPLTAQLHQPLPHRTFARGGVQLRPSFGLAGEQRGSFDGRLTAQVGVRAVDEPEAVLDLILGYEGRIDTWTVRASPLTQRVGIGAQARF